MRRYVAELTDHLADLKAEELRAGRSPEDANSAALLRLGKPEDLAKAMLEQRQCQAWCVRAPWAVFALVPLFVLWAAQDIALSLWFAGHSMEGYPIPLIPIHGRSIVYFYMGTAIYLCAPILIAWTIGLIAVRQRSNIIWPAIGLIFVSLSGGTGQARPAFDGVALNLPPLGHFYGLLIFSLAALPCVYWRVKKVYALD